MEITCPRTHQKHLWNRSYRTPIRQKTLDFQKGKLTSLHRRKGKRCKKKKERERHQSLGWDLHLVKGAVKGKSFRTLRSPSQAEKVESSAPSEWSTAACAQEAERRDFTTEVSATSGPQPETLASVPAVASGFRALD